MVGTLRRLLRSALRRVGVAYFWIWAKILDFAGLWGDAIIEITNAPMRVMILGEPVSVPIINVLAHAWGGRPEVLSGLKQVNCHEPSPNSQGKVKGLFLKDGWEIPASGTVELLLQNRQVHIPSGSISCILLNKNRKYPLLACLEEMFNCVQATEMKTGDFGRGTILVKDVFALTGRKPDKNYIRGVSVPVPTIQNYLHWMVSLFPRILTMHYDKNTAWDRIIISADAAQFQKDSLMLLDTRLTCIEKEFASFESIVLWSWGNILRPQRESLMVLRDWGKKMSEVRSQCDSDRIYISRRGSSRRTCKSEEWELAAQRLGFDVVQTHKLTFRQQMEIFVGARIIVGEHGAGFANCVWMPPGSRVVEIINSNFKMHSTEFLANSMMHKYELLDDRMNPEKALMDLV